MQTSGYQFTAPDLTVRPCPLRIGFKLKYKFIENKEQLDAVVEELKNFEWVSFDVETTGLNFLDLDLISFSFCYNETSYVISLKHNQKNSDLIDTDVRDFLNFLFSKKLFMHNARYDLRVVFKFYPELKNKNWYVVDTMSLVFIADSNLKMPSLKWSALTFLGLKQPEFSQNWAGLSIKDSNFNDFVYYSAFDAYSTLELGKLFYFELKSKYSFVVELYRKLLKPLMSFEEQEQTVDYEYLENLKNQILVKLEQLKTEIWKDTGVFNINSSCQLRQKLVEFGIYIEEKTPPSLKFPEGQMSTSNKVLVRYSHIDWIKKVLEYKALEKLLTTYVNSLLERKLRKLSNRFYYYLYNVPSGRLAAGKFTQLKKKDRNSHYFNCLNIQAVAKPKTVERWVNYDFKTHNIEYPEKDGQFLVECGSPDFNIRKAFSVPDKSQYVFLSTDYSSQEVVVGANLSKEPIWVKALKEGGDIHKETAIKVWGEDAYDKSKRKLAKIIVFSQMYGGTSFTLQQRLNLEKEVAEDLDKRFKEALGGYFLKWLPSVIRDAKRAGYVVNDFGFPRKLRWYFQQNYSKVLYAERSAVNHKIQSVGAVLIQLSIIKLYELIEKYFKNKVFFASTVHDEINFVVHKSVLLDFVREQNKIMESFTPKYYEIPLKVSNSIGLNWGELFDVVYNPEQHILIPKTVSKKETV